MSIQNPHCIFKLSFLASEVKKKQKKNEKNPKKTCFVTIEDEAYPKLVI